MLINKIKLKNFRNFKDKEFEFNKKTILIEGQNGTGKTSLLEALYYSCYLKSFRMYDGANLINFDSDYFFIDVELENNGETDQLQIAFSKKKEKLVKLNKKSVSNYKQILEKHIIVSITEDDLLVIQGYPKFRRQFLDQVLTLLDLNFVFLNREFKKILQQRNTLLIKRTVDISINSELYIWSKQLWEKSIEIQKRRIEILQDLQKEVNHLLKENFLDEKLEIILNYVPKKIIINQKFEDFWDDYKKNIFLSEMRWKRSLFGAHLDDFSITFRKQKARIFASRGQQKLIVFLLKVAQLNMLHINQKNSCLLIDDFLTDLDFSRAKTCLNILNKLDCQVLITCPLQSFFSKKFFKKEEFQLIEL